MTAVATHIHWDHIGGHAHYPDFYAHEAELDWLNGAFPLTMDTIRGMVVDRCDLPEGYDVNAYTLFQGTPTRLLHDGDTIDLGGRTIEVFHTPGHSRGICASSSGRAGISLPETWFIRIRSLLTIPPRTRQRTSAHSSGSPRCR